MNIGLVPDGGSSFLVPARVGYARAAEMAMLGERIPALKALEWGLINRVAADDVFEGEVDALAERLATGPTAPTPAPSASSTPGSTPEWTTSSSSRRAIQQEMAASGDFLEGVQAFLGKRAAGVQGDVTTGR